MHPYFSKYRNCYAGFLAANVMLAACQNPADGGDPRVCQQTYEFGNTGCFEVAGQVVGDRLQPLGGISVGPRPNPGLSLFNSAYALTDASGHFRIRVSRMLGGRPSGARPDTLSVYVVAADPSSAGVGVRARVMDSVLTLVTVAPVGVVPQALEIRIALPVP